MANQDKVNSNGYTITFAVGMALFVAAFLAFVSQFLQPMQDVNKAYAMKVNLLNAVGLDVEKLSSEEVENIYDSKFEGLVVNTKGDNIGDKAAAFSLDMAKEVKKDPQNRALPVFTYTGEDGQKQFIVQARGAGLWDAIWVYLALAEDKNTINGAVFGHKAETPGLGAKISDDAGFYEDFKGKKIFDGGEFVGITVLKGEGGNVYANATQNQVDGISGATMTCNGVTAMMQSSLGDYIEFLKQ